MAAKNIPPTTDIPARHTRRVRFDIDTTKADKLRRIAQVKGRTQSELVEFFIDSLPDAT